MSNHLSDQELNGYIHRTLSDVQRETMGRHLQQCDRCRARLQQGEQWRRHVTNDLDMTLCYARPSADMRFNQIQGRINRKRKFAFFRFHSVRMMGTVGKFALAILGLAFAITMFSSASQGAPLVQANPAPAIFPEAWDDPTPYQPVLISGEQVALESLTTAPIYHLDMTIGEDLRRVFGRQQLRYVNTTGQSLGMLYFSLFPNLTDGRLRVSSILVDGEPVQYELLDDLFLRIDLPYRLRALDTAVVQMDFRLDIGQTRHIFNGALGTADNTISLTQFHPQLVPYDLERGWDLSVPVHGVGNAQNSYYRVRVNAPASLTLLTSGSLIRANEINNGQQNSIFSAGPVGSFYLIGSEDFEVQLSETVGETTIFSYAVADYLQADAQEVLDVAANAVRLFNNQFGTYPFTELELIQSPILTLGTDELGFAGVSVLNSAERIETSLPQAVVSQVSGQWFRPLVVQSYQQNPWLADGLAAFATVYYYDEVGGRTAVWDLRAQWQQNWGEQELDSIDATVFDFTTVDYEKAMFGHTPLFLTWLAQMVGEETFAMFLQEYYTTYRWQGASGDVFATLLGQYCDCDLSPLFAQAADVPMQLPSQEDRLD